MSDPHGLEPRQRAFVIEYMKDMNGTRAAKRAGYSPDSARFIASENLSKPNIRKAIDDELAERAERGKKTAALILERLLAQFHADEADIYDEDTGAFLDVADMPPEWRRGMIAGVEIEEIYEEQIDPDSGKKRRVEIGRVQKIKLVPRTKIIELLGKHVDVQAFREQVANTNTRLDEFLGLVFGNGVRPAAGNNMPTPPPGAPARAEAPKGFGPGSLK